MTIFDTEDVLNGLIEILKGSLNDNIAYVNTARNAVKGDTLYIEPIENSKYNIEFLSESIKNLKGYFLLFSLESVPVPIETTASCVKEVTIRIEVCTFDNGDKKKENILYKLLRYQTALVRTLQQEPNPFDGFAKAKVTSLNPDVVPLGNNRIIITLGVDVTASITTP